MGVSTLPTIPPPESGLHGVAPSPALGNVHAFLIGILEGGLAAPLPLAPEVAECLLLPQPGEPKPELMAWLTVLDLAVSPVRLRKVFEQDPNQAMAEAFLRFYAAKPKRHEQDHSKMDLLATQVARQVLGSQAAEPASAAQRLESHFAALLCRLPSDSGSPYRELCDGLDRLLTEVRRADSIETVQALRVVERSRALKNDCRDAFYEPRTLAHVALYNLAVGSRFAELMRGAARAVKRLAQDFEQAADALTTGCPLSLDRGEEPDTDSLAVASQLQRLLGVKDMLEGPGSAPLLATPAPARERSFREFSPAPALSPASESGAPKKPSPNAKAPLPQDSPAKLRRAEDLAKSEESKLHDLRLLATEKAKELDPSQPATVRLRDSSITLTGPEIEALQHDFAGEDSFRARRAAMLKENAILRERVTLELDLFRSKKDSQYLWQVHGESLRYLLAPLQRALAASREVVQMAIERRLLEKAAILRESVSNLEEVHTAVLTELDGRYDLTEFPKAAPVGSDATR
jgi:hypothetical protein